MAAEWAAGERPCASRVSVMVAAKSLIHFTCSCGGLGCVWRREGY